MLEIESLYMASTELQLFLQLSGCSMQASPIVAFKGASDSGCLPAVQVFVDCAKLLPSPLLATYSLLLSIEPSDFGNTILALVS